MKEKLKIFFASLILLFLVNAGFCLTAEGQKTAPAKSQTASYTELLTKLKNGDLNIDFKALRLAFADDENAPDMSGEKDARNKMFKALSDKNYKDALKIAEEGMKTVYIDANLHYAAYVANKELGNTEKAEFHKSVLTKLLKSIENGGDGKTAQTAFMVIDIDEEYTLLRFLGYQMKSQGLNKEAGHTFDVLTAVNPQTQETDKFYFNIDKVWEKEQKLFSK